MKRFWGLLRVCGLSVVLLIAASIGVKRQAEARLSEAMRGLGEQLTQLHAVSVHSAPRRLFVNGLALGTVSASTNLSVNDALSRFQTLCHGVAALDVPATVRQKLKSASVIGPLNSDGVIREQTEHEGFLACLDTGKGTEGSAFLLRLQEFGRSRDLKSLGALRYALARRSGDTTTLVMFWSEGEAKLEELFKKDVDAPGRDLIDVPRPAQSRRILSAFEQGQPYMLGIYSVVDQSAAATRASYESVLRKAGWRVTSERDVNGTFRATKGGRCLLVRIREGRLGQVFLSIIDAE